MNSAFHSLSLAALALHLFSIGLFGALEPGYSHTHQSVSTLGAYSASHTAAFNILGLFLPGMLIAISFFKQGKLLTTNCTSNHAHKTVCNCMILFGIMFAGLAIPMDAKPLPLAGVTVHYILAYTSIIPFLAAALMTAVITKSPPAHKAYSVIFMITPALIVVIKSSATIGVPSGVVQRGLLACILCWAALTTHSNVKYATLKH